MTTNEILSRLRSLTGWTSPNDEVGQLFNALDAELCAGRDLPQQWQGAK